jgi:hypothetical protein
MSSQPAEKDPPKPRYVKVHELKPEGYESGCLRPLGLCELGGCCDVCFYGKRSARKPNDD